MADRELASEEEIIDQPQGELLKMTAKSFITRISFKFSGCNSFGCLSVNIILPFFFLLDCFAVFSR